MEDITTLDGLGDVLRRLRRRQARQRGGAQLTYRELAAATGWSHGIVGEYLSGSVLPPTDRFDVLIRLLGATPAEQGALATARDRVEERRRAGGAAPRRLPAGVPAFAGRERALAALDRLTGGVAILSGTAGVGKTSLAVHWAHRAAVRFPDGQLYLNLRGFDPAADPVRPAEALRLLLSALGLAPVKIPADEGEAAARLRDLLTARRLLMLLDNVASAEQVRPLLPAAPGCLTLITSRSQLTGLIAVEGAHPVPLDLPDEREAAALFAARLGAARGDGGGTGGPAVAGAGGGRGGADPAGAVAIRLSQDSADPIGAGPAGADPIGTGPSGAGALGARPAAAAAIGADRVDAEPEAVARIVRACARLPLALAVVAAHAAVRPEAPLGTFADQLAEDRLGTLETGDPAADVRSVFSWSYLRLPPAEGRVFRLLGLHPGVDASLAAVASLAGLPPAETRRLLAGLVRVHLLVEQNGRYAMHDLLRLYAADLANGGDPEAGVAAGESADAVARLRDHHLHSAFAAALRLHPAREPIALPPPVDGVTVTDPADSAAADTWFRAELPVLLAAVRGRSAVRGAAPDQRDAAIRGDAAIHGETAVLGASARDDPGDAYVWRLAWALADHLDRSGRWAEWIGTQGAALAAAERLGDDRWRLFAHRSLAGGAIRMDRLALARTHLEASAGIAAALGDAGAQARAAHALGWLAETSGDHAACLEHSLRAVGFFVEAGDRLGAARAANSAGLAAAHIGELERALELCGDALAASRELDDRAGAAGALDSLGVVQHKRGRLGDAVARYREAIVLYQGDTDRYGEADTRRRLADALDAAGDAAGATSERGLAQAILDDLAGQ
ncbi:tetratricopeptide repeat protein [Catenuloplanes japonicus]|uniref:tetratricopeptide repeat protein n=1 Tax=Catenuloplanes japonicus TaxID=33876 RepID=UPI0005527811|nr:tetratricopeptide repeat protein [Catenuloplanes japonicus]